MTIVITKQIRIPIVPTLATRVQHLTGLLLVSKFPHPPFCHHRSQDIRKYYFQVVPMASLYQISSQSVPWFSSLIMRADRWSDESRGRAHNAFSQSTSSKQNCYENEISVGNQLIKESPGTCTFLFQKKCPFNTHFDKTAMLKQCLIE